MTTALGDVTRIAQGDPAYPASLGQSLGDTASASLTTIGNLGLLSGQALAFFCSVKSPGNLILKTYDLARALRDAGVTVAGGFHSPMEKECLRILLRGSPPVVVCPARSVTGMRIPSGWRTPLAEGRLLVISPFPESARRVTADSAAHRNEFVTALADRVFIAHASPGGNVERLCRTALGWGKPVWTFDSPENAAMLLLGARPLRAAHDLVK